MQIRIDTIHEVPKKLSLKRNAEAFPLLDELQKSGEILFLQDVEADVAIFKEYDHYTANGNIKTDVQLVCSRCLVKFTKNINSSFKIIYRKPDDIEESQLEDEIELSEEDLISSYLTGDEIDLNHEIETQIAMEIDFKPLCSETCKGLCPECGADLNLEKCSCSEHNKFSPFSALQNFKVEKKG